MSNPRKIIQLVATEDADLFALCDDGAVLHYRTVDGKLSWFVLSETCPQADKSDSPQAKAGRARQAKMTPEERQALVAKARAVRDENARLRKLKA